MTRLVLTIFFLCAHIITIEASCILPPENTPIENTKSANEWFELGVASFYDGDFNTAIRQLQFAIQRDPNLYVAYDFLAASYIGNQNNYSAICTYMHLLSINPQNAEAYVGMARAKINIGDIKNAEKDLAQAEAIDPELALIYETRAETALRKQDIKQALNYYKIAIEKDTTNTDYYLSIASLLFHHEDYAAANPYFDKAISFGFPSMQALINSGITKQMLGQLDKAEILFNEAVQHFPDIADSYFFRGAFLYNVQRFSKAIQDFENAISIEPSKSVFYFNRALSYNAVDSTQLALKDLSQAIEIDSAKRANYYTERADIYLELSDFNAALNDFDKLTQLFPENPNYNFSRGKVLLQLQRTKDACKDLKVADEGGIEEAKVLLKKNCSDFITSPRSQLYLNQDKTR